jgi:putative NADH-flavin reductase
MATAKGADVAISAYGPGHANSELLVQAATALVAGLRQAGVRRFIMAGGAGSLEVAPGLRLVDTPNFPAEWKPIALAHAEALDVLKACDLDWTSVSPAAVLQPGARTGIFRLGKDALLTDSKGDS